MQGGKIEAHNAKDSFNLGLQSTMWLWEAACQAFQLSTPLLEGGTQLGDRIFLCVGIIGAGICSRVFNFVLCHAVGLRSARAVSSSVARQVSAADLAQDLGPDFSRRRIMGRVQHLLYCFRQVEQVLLCRSFENVVKSSGRNALGPGFCNRHHGHHIKERQPVTLAPTRSPPALLHGYHSLE